MKLCCEAMRRHLEHTCDQHGENCPDRVILLSALQERYLLVAQNAAYDFTHCPWCGTRVQDDLPDIEPGWRLLYAPPETPC